MLPTLRRVLWSKPLFTQRKNSFTARRTEMIMEQEWRSGLRPEFGVLAGAASGTGVKEASHRNRLWLTKRRMANGSLHVHICSKNTATINHGNLAYLKPSGVRRKFSWGGFIQWHMVVICIWCTLFVTSEFEVIFTFTNQRCGEVDRHNMHILLHALRLFYVSLHWI